MDVLENLKTATETLKDAHRAVAYTAGLVTRDKNNLASNETAAILQGLEGKNEAERKARLADLTLNEQVALQRSEASHREAQLRLTLAELDYKLAREAAALHRAELLNRAPIAAD